MIKKPKWVHPQEKFDRNVQIFCEKEGLDHPDQYGKEQPNKKETYRELSDKYDLAINVIQRIVKKYRERYPNE